MSTFSAQNAKLFASAKGANIPIFEAGNEEYERSVATANLLYRYSRPPFVVQPKTIEHVQFIVKQAKEQKIPITIKNGGHSYAGFSIAERGISLDLTRMDGYNKVDLDIPKKTATLCAGSLWGHAYRALVNGQHDGLVINGGRCPFVGVSGFILGGGLGPFTRSYGMGIDTLKEVTMITAKGDRVTVSERDSSNSKEGELFWALRGGGGGNFGVVVQLKLKIEELKSKDVVAGRYVWNPKTEQDRDKTMKTFYTAKWPTEMTIDSTWLCEMPGGASKKVPAIRFLAYYNGDKSNFDKVIDQFLPRTELGTQLKLRSIQEKSTRFFHETLVAQWSEETTKSFPQSKAFSIYSSFVFKNGSRGIDNIISIIKEEMDSFKEKFSNESCQFNVTWIHSGGKASDKKRADTAFRWRDGIYHTYITISWEEKWLQREMSRVCIDIRKRLRQHSICKRAAFVNFPDRQMDKDGAERAYYGNNRQKLQRVKKSWDPDNYWNWAQSIRFPQPKQTSRLENVQLREVVDVSMRAAGRSSDTMSIASVGGSDSEGGGEQETFEGDDETWTEMVSNEQWENLSGPPPPIGTFLAGYPFAGDSF